MIYAVEEIDINGKDPEKVVIDKESLIKSQNHAEPNNKTF